MRLTAAAALCFAVAGWAMPLAAPGGESLSPRATKNCSRECMTDIVSQILDSMVAHNPHTLPLAQVYKATEDSHGAALDMMTAWRTVTQAGNGTPNLLTIDTTAGTAYFSLDINEGSATTRSVMHARIKVVNQKITELEIFINRSRGDHGFSFSAQELPKNYARWMNPPANRTIAPRSELELLSSALFNPNVSISPAIGDSCQFTEEGWQVIDPGPDGNGSYAPLGCGWHDGHPADAHARTNLVVDEKYGIVVTGGMVPGIAFPYANVSAFIPDDLPVPQVAQEAWFARQKADGVQALLQPTHSTGDTLQVVQYYNSAIQGVQLMIHLGGPNMTSAWLI